MTSQWRISSHARQDYGSTPHFRQNYASDPIRNGPADAASKRDTVSAAANLWFRNGKTISEVTPSSSGGKG
jgi:hypothetical protein